MKADITSKEKKEDKSQDHEKSIMSEKARKGNSRTKVVLCDDGKKVRE